MATFNANTTTNSANVLSSSVAAATATFIVPSTTTTATPLQLETFGAIPGHTPFVNAATPLHHHQTNSSTSSYTFVQIKREPCQVSEISSNNCNLQQQHQHHHHHHQQHQTASTSLTATGVGTVSSSSVTASASSKTMSSSTLTTLVKIEASSPKVPDMDKQSTLNASLSTTIPTMAGTSNSVPIGIAVARKRPQESSNAALNSSTAMPLQQSLNKDMNCFGIRVADLGGVGTGCGNIYFTGNGDLMTSSATAEELALSAAGVQNVNRAPSTFWPYQNALPIESVISMSPATVGLQYSRDASRGQVVLLPATPAALDPFQQPAAAFVWPSAYIPQATAATTPAAAAAALQPPPNFLFPSMGTHSTLNATPSYATSLQLYLAAAAGSSTLCQHTNQQTNTSSTSTTNSINLSLGNGATSSCTSSSSSTSSRFLSLATTPQNGTDLSAMLPRQTPSKQLPIAPLLLPPAAMKIEEYNSTEFKHTTMATHQLPPPQTTALNFETRDKTTTTMTATTNLLELQPNVAQQALNLVRLPTPPTSATIDSVGQQSQQILFQAGTAVQTPTLLNLSTATATPPSIGPLTPAPCDDGALNFKTTTPLTPPQIVIGVPRINTLVSGGPPSLPQMQDVNIQTDTPVCSEDENSSCPLSSVAQQPAPESPKPIENVEMQVFEHPQPLELTKSSENVNECHNTHVTHAYGISDTQEPPTLESVQVPLEQQRPAEDLTGLELLSNISTNSTPFVRVKQEPQDQSEPITEPPLPIVSSMPQQSVDIMAPVEPLGGLNLLCALAEQRIQEEEVQGSLFATPSTRTPTPPDTSLVPSGPQQPITPTCFAFPPQTQSPSFTLVQPLQNVSSLFPSMEGIELPTTSGLNGGEQSNVGTPVKRKKHKHSKSSSSASDSRRSTQRCSKKNKKKRKHKQPPLSPNELDINDDQLQVELRSALNTMDPSYKRLGQWPNPQQLFNIMESNMRMRLADINRQYQKKKRKLDEMSKHKKKKKCSKLTQLQQPQPQPPQLTLTSSLSSLHTGSALGTSSPLRDYKFSTFSISSSGPSTNGLSMGSTSYLQPSSFLRFQDKTHAFPPPPTAMTTSKPTNSANDAVPSTSSSSFVRLEPSALDAANNRCTSSAAGNGIVTSSTASSRIAHKHASTEKTSQKHHASKERKLMALSRATTPSTTTSTNTTTVATMHQSHHSVTGNAAENGKLNVKPNPFDKELQLTNEHLYCEETRVLTDMGGLFYAGVMKPLQPPDVYAVTLDGERGNKSHIMSREEILKDTILEVAPKSVDSVPVGTRLCAYWSQQYRCLYPGRAIESEVLDDGAVAHDFVSVEFDDGDSGRIRLQNIRLLLSDYPIVEYNDNPLYSLGKQKKSALKADEHNSLSGDDHHSHHGFAMSSDNTTSLAATMELFTQRSEKKRLKKSLKKKTQNDETAANVVVAASDNGVVNVAASGDGNDSNRKHHKHKKRKKHKKHHRKVAEAESQNFLRTSDGSGAKAFVGKIELETQDDNDNEQLNDENLVGNEETLADNDEADEADEEPEVPAVRRVASSIKQETSIASAAAPLAATIKVKTEQLDMEEETTSNMMSEVSDEAKGDEVVEHNNAKGSSKIAAFLPERQLWGWFGTAYRKAGVKGRARKQFYKTIKRGKETISVGDCAVFLSTGRPDRPYIGRIESMWETTSGNKVVRVRWFYHPEETSGCPKLKYPGALFESPHEDENDVQTISHRCEVLEFLCYFNKFGVDSKQYQSIYDNNDTYYLAGYYNPRLLVLKLQDDIPTLEELQNTTDV